MENRKPNTLYQICCGNILPYMACTQSHDFQRTISMAGMLHSAQWNNPMCPNAHQHHDTGIYQHKRDPRQIRQFVHHSAYNVQELKENCMFDPDHLKWKEGRSHIRTGKLLYLVTGNVTSRNIQDKLAYSSFIQISKCHLLGLKRKS